MQVNRIIELLAEILKINSPVGNEIAIGEYCEKNLGPKFEFERDTISPTSYNLRATRKSNIKRSNSCGFPLLNAHLDTIHATTSSYEIVENSHHQFITSDKFLGLDDKLGIALILAIAEETPDLPLKIVFTAQEEYGQGGARNINEQWLKDVNYCISLDRILENEQFNIVNSYQEKLICTDEFLSSIQNYFSDFLREFNLEYQIKGGFRADSFVLAYPTKNKSIFTRTGMPYLVERKHRLNCVNLSTGFQHEHEEEDCADLTLATKIGTIVSIILQDPQFNQRNWPTLI